MQSWKQSPQRPGIVLCLQLYPKMPILKGMPASFSQQQQPDANAKLNPYQP
jgi:hypothetical protein